MLDDAALDAAVAAHLADWPVIVRQAVPWGDMDAYRHVNNVVYFRYFENARLAYLERLAWRDLEDRTGVGPIVASIQARFRRAIAYPDRIAVGARLLDLGTDRFTLEHKIVSAVLGDVATLGQGVIVTYHYPSERKVDVPEELRRRILALEGRSEH